MEISGNEREDSSHSANVWAILWFLPSGGRGHHSGWIHSIEGGETEVDGGGAAVIQPVRNKAGRSEFTGVDYAGGVGHRILTLRGDRCS